MVSKRNLSVSIAKIQIVDGDLLLTVLLPISWQKTQQMIQTDTDCSLYSKIAILTYSKKTVYLISLISYEYSLAKMRDYCIGV